MKTTVQHQLEQLIAGLQKVAEEIAREHHNVPEIPTHGVLSKHRTDTYQWERSRQRLTLAANIQYYQTHTDGPGPLATSLRCVKHRQSDDQSLGEFMTEITEQLNQLEAQYVIHSVDITSELEYVLGSAQPSASDSPVAPAEVAKRVLKEDKDTPE